MAKNVNSVILALFEDSAVVRSRDVAAALGVTRQAAHRHLRRLVEAGTIELLGAGRGAHYRKVTPHGGAHFTFATEGLEEDRVWEALAARSAAIGELGEQAREIMQYAVTEVVNNAIDHSGADEVSLAVELTKGMVAIEVTDKGVGLFEHIRQSLDLESELDALREVSKGKLTTMPSRHTGEGLFFVSKAVDLFEVESGTLRWVVDNIVADVFVEDLERPHAGTAVTVSIAPSRDRDLGALFEAYTVDHEFVRTRTVIKLFAHGVRFISRSEAKRLVHGLERFREVILDFQGVRGVGQGFADEIFRVWATAHPEVSLVPVNMSRAVDFLVERARRRGADAGDT